MMLSQHVPNLKELLPYTQGKGLPNPPSISVPRTKKNYVENVLGVDWYQYYVPQKYCLSLSDLYDESQLLRMFNVCFNVPAVGEGKSRRFYTAFRSPLDFLHYIKKIPRDKWAFFEYILGPQVQKLYFDIDIEMEKFQELMPGADIEIFCRELISEIIQQIDETFDDRGFLIDPAQHILLFSSHSTAKYSFHLIVNHYAVMNHRENYILANEVLELLPRKYLPFLDMGMWKVKQQLRLYQSQKPGSNRPKIFVPQFYYHDQLIESRLLHDLKLPTDPTAAETLAFTTILMASCITVTQDCTILPSTLDVEGSFSRNFTAEIFADDEIDSEVLEAIQERVDERFFKIYRLREQKGTFITLTRQAPAHCSLCNSYHENDNAFMTINAQGQVYFHCHGVRRHLPRNSAGQLMGATCKLIADVSDLLPSRKEKLAELHKESIINQLIEQNPPTIQTIHGQLRVLAAQSNKH